MNKETFIKEVNKLGITLTDDMLLKLDRYYHLLVEWNNKMNLTSITKEEDVYLKHFYDSLTLYKTPKELIDLNSNIKVCDVGTGAGFPGIVLKIVFPSIDITLVDSLNKRITFLNEVIKGLNLTNIKTIHSRIEEYSKNLREEFDLVTSRAVANLKILSEISLPLVKVNGYFIPMKANVEEEIKESTEILKKLDSKIIDTISFNLPIENSVRNLVIIKKLKETNKKYPREFNKIKKG